MKTLYLVDAYALIFKYYYAFLNHPMRNREGLNTSAIFGFVKFLRDIQRREHPDLLGVAFDPKGGCFRREIFPEYKANRSATPEDIILSVPYIKRLLQAMCIPILEVAGFEADDVIGTLSQKGVKAGYEVFMVTPDKDYGQLVGDHCSIYKQRGQDGVIERVDRAAIREKYGIDDPQLVRDILALWGDTADNIPGVPGVGEKTAAKLVQQWGTVENILEHVSEIKGKQGEKIAAWRENLLLAKTLTTIRLDVPIELNEQELTICSPRVEELRSLFAELNFHAFMQELPAEQTPIVIHEEQVTAADAPTAADVAQSDAVQGDLFSAFNPEPTPVPEAQDAPRAEAQDQPQALEYDLFGAAPTPTPQKAQGALPQADLPHTEAAATAQTTPHTYTLVEDVATLHEVVAQLQQQREFAFDTETTGLDVFNDKMVGLSLSIEAHRAWYVAFADENRKAFIEVLKPLFEDEKIAKIGQNVKFDYMVLHHAGISVRGLLYDTMILHYLVDPESRHNMNALAIRYLNYAPIEIETLIGRGRNTLTMDRVARPLVAEYAGEDADITWQLKQVLWAEIQRLDLEKLYLEIEEPLIRVLADIELTGVKIDVEALHGYGEELSRQLVRIEDEIRALADEPQLNVNSPRQLGEVLFAKLKISDKPKMTKTKQYKTDEEYLQGFASQHRIVALILEYRGIKKLLSTYVEALPQLVNPTTGRIHTSFNQAVTATGRLSSTNPNLQNIPVRDALGKRIRQAFVPSDEQHVLLSADYSQVELRMMAHLSDDEHLLEAFRADRDIHAATAARLFHKPIEQVTSDERRKAKTANFGIIYGISAFGLSQRLEIPRKEAKAIIDGYFASYPKVQAYMERVIQEARERGYVETIFGRRRYLNDITSHNAIARGLAERNAVNAPIQGSAADVMKIAMIRVARRFDEEGIRSKVILQVHDELIVDLLRSERDRVVRMVVEEMERAAQLKVRLTADAGIGENWLEAH